MEVGLGLGHIVLDWDPAPLPKMGHNPHILAHVYCGQAAGWIKMSRCHLDEGRPRPGQHCVSSIPHGPRVWKAMPSYLRQDMNYSHFKRALKGHMFRL